MTRTHRTLQASSRGTYGTPRIHAPLARVRFVWRTPEALEVRRIWINA